MPTASAGPPEAADLTRATVAKDGNVFSVTLRDGAVPADGVHPLGVYADDCRHLSAYEWTLGGERPRLLAAAVPDGRTAVHELTNPGLTAAGGVRLPEQALRLRLERRLDAGGEMFEDVTVESFAAAPAEVVLELRVAADFAPMLAVRGILPPPDPRAATVRATPEGVRLEARGRDGVLRCSELAAEPAPGRDGDRLRFVLRVRRGEPARLRLRWRFGAGPVAAAQRPAPAPEAARLEVDDELTARILDRALLDLRMLRSSLDGHIYYAAGVPWYATLFGRDSLIAAWQTLALDPGAAEGTLRVLARRLGRRDDPEHEEDPGKVLHELRVGEAAAPGATPLARYYGTVDATPLFLCLLCEHADWTGDLTLLRELRGEVEAMLAWLDGPGDRDADGLLDYAARARGGLRNQGWKDSPEGVCHADGTPVEPPVALVEAQGYAVRARRGLARLLALDGDAGRAAALARAADAHAARLERFRLPEGGYAMAIGGDGRLSRAPASNQGHLLWAGAVGARQARSIRDALMGEAMFSGWGIRTLGAGVPAHNPLGYHLGTVWPHDTAMIAVGLRRYGYDEDFARLQDALLSAASRSEDLRLPELFAGLSRDESPAPVPYPVACRPQAWAAGAVPSLLVAGLGLRPDALEGRLRVERPLLPAWVDRATVRGLRVGRARVDLAFARGPGGAVSLAGAEVDGDLRVETG